MSHYRTFPYDKTLKVGDIITSSESGYYRIKKVERRYFKKSDASTFDFLEKEFGVRPKVGDELNPVIHSELLLTEKFKPAQGKDECDATFCKKVNKRLRTKILKILAES